MISITGRMPVIAAPTPMPAKPASEIGVSITRSVPNSSTSPDSTLKGVPASATSSPRIQTRESRRISSASASRTACAKVSSRSAGSGIDILLHFSGIWIRRGESELGSVLHLGSYLCFYLRKERGIRETLFTQPYSQNVDWIALALPLLFLLLRAVVVTVDIPDMMARIAVGVAQQETRAFSGAREVHKVLGGRMYGADVLSIDTRNMKNAESRCAGKDVPSRSLQIMGVFVVEIV